MLGEKNTKNAKIIKNISSANKSLITIYGWNGTVSFEGFFISIPMGLLFPGTCNAQIWRITILKLKMEKDNAS